MTTNKMNKFGKRFGGPPKPKKTSSQRKAAIISAANEAEAYVDPASDDLFVYVDDERRAPSGMLLLKSAAEFRKLRDKLRPGQLIGLSLDWYLGPEAPNGMQIARELAVDMVERPEIYSGLEVVSYHSSDIIEAGKMARTVCNALRGTELEEIGHNCGPPFRL